MRPWLAVGVGVQLTVFKLIDFNELCNAIGKNEWKSFNLFLRESGVS